jgi:hypothetical protein
MKVLRRIYWAIRLRVAQYRLAKAEARYLSITGYTYDNDPAYNDDDLGLATEGKE